VGERRWRPTRWRGRGRCIAQRIPQVVKPFYPTTIRGLRAVTGLG